MTTTSTTNNGFYFIKPFRYLFDSPHAGMNLLFGTLCMFVPLFGPLVLLGWQIRIMRSLVQKKTPEVVRFDLNDFVEYLKDGFIPFLTSLVLMLPFVFLTMIIGIIAAIAIPALTGNGEALPPEVILPIVGIGAIIGIPILIVYGVIFSAAMTRAFLTGDLGQTFQIKPVLEYAQLTWKSVLVVMLFFVPASILVMALGMLALYIGIYPASIILNLAGIHFMSQIYQQYLDKGGEPIPVRVDEPKINTPQD